MATRYPRKGKGTKWTTKELEGISADWKGDTLNDGGSLYGEVRANREGTVSIVFNYMYKSEGKLHKYYCGSFPNASIKSIRQERDAAKAILQTGLNPNDKKRTDRIKAQQEATEYLAQEERRQVENLTLDDLFTAWTTEASGVKRKDGNEAIKRSYAKHLQPRLGSRVVRDITDNDLLETLRIIKDNAKADNPQRALNRTVEAVYKDLRQMFLWAEKRKPWRGLMAEGNPALMVTPAQVKGLQDSTYIAHRERVLLREEIAELARILGMDAETYAPGTGDRVPLHYRGQCAVWICLGTLCRIGELLMARWEHVDFGRGEWFIPAEHTKTQEAYRVALSPFVLSQFRHLHAVTGEYAHCFPSRDGRSHVGLNTLTKTIGDKQMRFMQKRKSVSQRTCNNALVLSEGANGKWTLHDLRRTGATMMQMMGVSVDIINRCQNHAARWDNKVSQNYLHYDYAKEKAEAWMLWGQAIEEMLG